jgi:acyl dehydratase
MSNFYVDVGDSVSFSKTVGEYDVYGFAGITGDFAPIHTDEEFMRRSSYGERIAHGVLSVGFMSTASSQLLAGIISPEWEETPVSLGYDRIRFLLPVFFGDTLTVTYTVKEVDAERRRSRSDIQVTNQKDEVVSVAEHIMKWVKNA